MKIKALFALAPPMKFDSDQSANQYYSFVNEYSKPKEIKIRGSNFHDGASLLVQTYECSTALKKKYFNDALIIRKGDFILEFVTHLNYPNDYTLSYPDGTKAPFSRSELESIWKDWLPIELDLTVQTYLVAICLAYCGAVRPFQNVWIAGRSRLNRSNSRKSVVHEAVEYLREQNAFPNIELDVNQVVRWVFSQNGIFDGYSDTPASRSLNYFTRLFVREFRDDELSDLIWGLAGVEALLIEGGRSSTGQLREKLNALLASNIDSKWLSAMIDRSYNFRSRMIHGNRQLRSWFRKNEDDAEKRFDEEYSSLRFVVGVLVLVLRYVIAENAKEIRFKTVIV